MLREDSTNRRAQDDGWKPLRLLDLRSGCATLTSKLSLQIGRPIRLTLSIAEARLTWVEVKPWRAELGTREKLYAVMVSG